MGFSKLRCFYIPQGDQQIIVVRVDGLVGFAAHDSQINGKQGQLG